MDHAEFISGQRLRETGQLQPMLFLIGKTGAQIFHPDSSNETQSKDDFELAARLLCVAHSASVIVMVMGGWAKSPSSDPKLSPKNMRRIELVLLVGEARGINRRKYLPVLRTKAGQFQEIGAELILQGGELEGRFSQFLAPNQPSPTQRNWALSSLGRLDLLKAK